MINFSKQSLSLRRQQLIRSLQQQQHQLIKSKHRYQFECQVTNPVAEVWRLKNALAQYNIHYYSKEILEIVNSIRPYLTDLMFLRELKSSRLIQDLLGLVLGQLKAKSYLQAPLLAQIMVQLSAQLLKGTQLFLMVVEENLGWLLFAVQKYPLNNKIVQKVTNCIAALHPINHHQSMKKHGFISPQQQQLIISKLMEIYLVRDCYQTSCGMLEFVEPNQKGDQRWFRNAVNALEIVCCLLPSLHQNQCLSQSNILKQGLVQGMRAFINKKRQVHPSIQQQSTESQTLSESHQYYFDREFDECITYFISILLDIFMFGQQLMDEQEQTLLKQVLSILLWEAKKRANIVNAAKIIKILYEQVILDEADLLEIGNRYEELYEFVQNIISNDCV